MAALIDSDVRSFMTTYNRFEIIFVRDPVMAADADSSHQEREGSRRAVPAHVQGHHGAEATHRVGRLQRR